MAELKHIIRIRNTDLNGSKSISQAIQKIKGIGVMFSSLILDLAGIERSKKAGALSDAEVKKIEDILANPLKYDAPLWMLNRRKDPEEGIDKHITTTDLDFIKANDIKRLRKMKCYIGFRHGLKLPLRGQRTKSNFRKSKGKSSLGVKRKK